MNFAIASIEHATRKRVVIAECCPGVAVHHQHLRRSFSLAQQDDG
jgi:hypothetical protein